VLLAPRIADAGADDDFPRIILEKIVVHGNTATSARIIKHAVLVREGEELSAGDPRLKASRFAILGLGFFDDVRLSLERGSERGKVILVVDVSERGTATLNRLWLGTSDETPLWAGLDVGDTNFVGTGLAVGLAAVWARAARLEHADPQVAMRVRFADARNLPWGFHAELAYDDAQEPIGTAVSPYTRAGGTVGASYDLGLATLSLDLRYEHVAGGAGLPGLVENYTTAGLGFVRDSRPDPVLPYTGTRLSAAAEVSPAHARILGSFEDWFPFAARKHVISLHFAAGGIAGDAPIFDRFYVGELDPLLSPRALDLVVSTRPAPDFLDTGMDRLTYGTLAARASIEYSYALFRGRRPLYGGDLFASVVLFGLATPDEAAVDLGFNAGLRIDSDLGVFELSLGNALGRIPY
jgi:outer membrane protein insertion porin family